MKSIIAITVAVACALFAATAATAQIDAGTVEAGVNTGSWGFDPYIGYFIVDDLEIGGGAGFRKADDDEYSLIKVFGRYHFPRVEESSFAFFADASVEREATEDDDDNTVRLGGGVKFFATEILSVNLFGNYYKTFSNKDEDGFEAGIGLSVFIK